MIDPLKLTERSCTGEVEYIFIKLTTIMYAFTALLFVYTCGDFDKDLSSSSCEPIVVSVYYEFILLLLTRERKA